MSEILEFQIASWALWQQDMTETAMHETIKLGEDFRGESKAKKTQNLSNLPQKKTTFTFFMPDGRKATKQV